MQWQLEKCSCNNYLCVLLKWWNTEKWEPKPKIVIALGVKIGYDSL